MPTVTVVDADQALALQVMVIMREFASVDKCEIQVTGYRPSDPEISHACMWDVYSGRDP